MSIRARVHAVLGGLDVAFEVLECDPELADTEVFCERYGIPRANSANAILVKSKSGERRFAMCVALATTRLDVNKVVRKRLGTRRISFASREETEEMTGMMLGGVTPIGLPESLPVWVDARIRDCEYVILGGGDRASKLKVSPALFDRIANCEFVDGLAVEPGKAPKA